MIYRVIPNKDTFITNAKKNNVQQTGSNFGYSEILDLYKKAAISGAIGNAATASITRVLLQFDTNEFSELTASGEAPSSGAKYRLKLYDAQHSDILPSSFDVTVKPLSRSWDEGKGIDNDYFRDKGFANWEKSKSNVFWTNPGGDTVSGYEKTYHFDTGHENIDIDITSIVNSWLTGSLENNGLLIKLSQSHEDDFNDYYQKKFHARNSRFLDKRPVLEMQWDDSHLDDRDFFIFDNTGSLFLYNVVKGRLQNISSAGTGSNVIDVDIHDASGSVLSTSASFTGLTGIYSASFSLPTGSYSGSVFYDKWHLNGESFLTGAFYPYKDGPDEYLTQKKYSVIVKNLKKEYSSDEKVRFNLFVKADNHNPHVVQTGSLSLSNEIITEGYYKIENLMTKETVIPFGTGSIKSTRLSYDKNGNYFNFYMKSISKGNVYKIKFLFDVDGEERVIDPGARFKVV